MQCSHCGHSNQDGWKFCGKCGNALDFGNEDTVSQNMETSVISGYSQVLSDEGGFPGNNKGQYNGTDISQAPYAQSNYGNDYGSSVPPNSSAHPSPQFNSRNTANKNNQSLIKIKKKSKGKIVPIILSLVLVFAVIIGTVSVLAVNAKKTEKYEALITGGNKYLTQMKYDEAIISFTEAIELSPKKDPAYLGLADTYNYLGEPQKALEVLEGGYARNKSEVLKSAIEAQETIQIVDFDPGLYPDVLITVYMPNTSDPSKSDFLLKDSKNASEYKIQKVTVLDKHTFLLETRVSVSRDKGEVQRYDLIYSAKTEIVCKMQFIIPGDPNVNISLEQIDTTNYPNVKLFFRIEDESGEVIGALPKEVFSLYELSDGAILAREVKKVAQLEKTEPVNVTLVADTSDSMDYSAGLATAKPVMKDFTDSLQYVNGDVMEILAFNSYIYEVQSFSGDPSKLKLAIDAMSTDGLTALYDALMVGVSRLAVRESAKCLIAFTDGEDNMSSKSPSDVIQLANRYSIPVFIVGVGVYNTQSMEDIAESTGGFYTDIRNISELKRIYEDVYKKQKQLYVVEYSTDDTLEELATRDFKMVIRSEDYIGRCDDEYAPEKPEPPQVNIPVKPIPTPSASSGVNYAPVFSSIVASSVFPPQTYDNYEPQNVFDSNIKTAWVEGAAGEGLGEWIEFHADVEQAVSGMWIVNGFNKTEDLYYKNHRVKDIEIVFSDGSSLTRTVADSFEQYQQIPFGTTVMSKSVRVIIRSTYPGSVDYETCISEIAFY